MYACSTYPVLMGVIVYIVFEICQITRQIIAILNTRLLHKAVSVKCLYSRVKNLTFMTTFWLRFFYD